MMKKFFTVAFVTLSFVFASACQKDTWPAQPDWSKIPNPEDIENAYPHPEDCDNNIVAHMGGGTEAGVPVNSLAAVKYAMGLKLYGVELDAYWTKDDNIVIGHANSKDQIANLTPYECTLAEMKAGVRLSNGERIPSLEEVLDLLMVEGGCTRLVIDIKRLDYPAQKPQYVIKAAEAICRIVKEKQAEKYVILLCTGYNTDAMKKSWAAAQEHGLEIAMNSGKDVSEIKNLGFNWVNLAAVNMIPEAGGSGALDVKKYADAGISVSIYNVDKQSGDVNAVYSDKALEYYKKNYKSFRMICSNYPAWLKENLGTL